MSDTSSSDSEIEDKKKRKKHKDKKKKKKHKKDKKRQKLEHTETSTRINSDDYFLRSTEFRVWLHLQGKAFDRMDSKKAHSLFNKFVDDWNEGLLDPMYYQDSIPAKLQQESRRPTTHRWKFNISRRDENILSSVKETVSEATQSMSSTSSTALQQRPVKLSANRVKIAPRDDVAGEATNGHTGTAAVTYLSVAKK